MFEIQISNPTILVEKIDDEVSLEEAIESIFPLETEYLILIWNNIFIPLSYKYDISLMALDFVKIVDFLENNKEIELKIYWASNTFASVWNFEKINESVKISSKWDNVIGGTEELLNKANENFIAIEEIKMKINRLLCFLSKALQKNGINTGKVNGFDSIEKRCS